jgi:flagellar hook-associated protein 3 FlgL
MRISTAWAQKTGTQYMLKQQAALNQTQLKLSSGKRILTPSEDPRAAVQIVDLKQNIKQTEQYQENINTVKQRLSLEESSLQNVIESIHRIRELSIQGLNDVNSANNRKGIAAELDQLNEQILSVANSKNSNGEYLFSGYLTDQTPFSEQTPATIPATFDYAGDDNQRKIQIGPTRTITDGNPGQEVFGTSGADSLFEIVDELSNGLKNDNPQAGTLDKLTTSLEKILTVQATIGARMNALDRQDSLNQDTILSMKTVLSETEDLDYAEAISKFNLQSVSLQAAQQAYSKVQGLSLFNFL